VPKSAAIVVRAVPSTVESRFCMNNDAATIRITITRFVLCGGAD
jgi:hypothetical protein